MLLVNIIYKFLFSFSSLNSALTTKANTDGREVVLEHDSLESANIVFRWNANYLARLRINNGFLLWQTSSDNGTNWTNVWTK